MSIRTLRLAAAALVAVCAAVAFPAGAHAAVGVTALHRGAAITDPVATQFAPGDAVTAEGSVDKNAYYQWYLYTPGGSVADSTSCTKAGAAASNPVKRTWNLGTDVPVTPAGRDWTVVLYQYGDGDSWCWLGWTSAAKSFVVRNPQAITFPALANKVYGDGDVTPAATAPGGNVTYGVASDSTGCTILSARSASPAPGPARSSRRRTATAPTSPRRPSRGRSRSPRSRSPARSPRRARPTTARRRRRSPVAR